MPPILLGRGLCAYHQHDQVPTTQRQSETAAELLVQLHLPLRHVSESYRRAGEAAACQLLAGALAARAAKH